MNGGNSQPSINTRTGSPASSQFFSQLALGLLPVLEVAPRHAAAGDPDGAGTLGDLRVGRGCGRGRLGDRRVLGDRTDGGTRATRRCARPGYRGRLGGTERWRRGARRCALRARRRTGTRLLRSRTRFAVRGLLAEVSAHLTVPFYSCTESMRGAFTLTDAVRTRAAAVNSLRRAPACSGGIARIRSSIHASVSAVGRATGLTKIPDAPPKASWPPGTGPPCIPGFGWRAGGAAVPAEEGGKAAPPALQPRETLLPSSPAHRRKTVMVPRRLPL